jgi:hypothetical protein
MGQAPWCVRISARPRVDGNCPPAHGCTGGRFPRSGRHRCPNRSRARRIQSPCARRASHDMDGCSYRRVRAQRNCCNGSQAVTAFIASPACAVLSLSLSKKNPYREDTGTGYFCCHAVLMAFTPTIRGGHWFPSFGFEQRENCENCAMRADQRGGGAWGRAGLPFQRALFSISPRKFPRGAEAPVGASGGGPRQPAAISGAFGLGDGGGCAGEIAACAKTTLHRSKRVL